MREGDFVIRQHDAHNDMSSGIYMQVRGYEKFNGYLRVAPNGIVEIAEHQPHGMTSTGRRVLVARPVK